MSEVQQLRDQIAQLEEALGLNLQLPNEFGLTPLEMKIAGLLTRREIANRTMIFAALYGSRPECDQPDIKVIDVHICKLRRKLAAKDVTIKTRFGVGYYVDARARATLREICETRAGQ